MTAMLKRCCLILSSLGALRAQQTIAPTPEAVGIARGDDVRQLQHRRLVRDSATAGVSPVAVWILTAAMSIMATGIRLLATNLQSLEGRPWPVV